MKSLYHYIFQVKLVIFRLYVLQKSFTVSSHRSGNVLLIGVMVYLLIKYRLFLILCFQLLLLRGKIVFSVPSWLSAKESACQCKRPGFDPWVGKVPWRCRWQPTSVFLPGKSHGLRNLEGYSPWGSQRVGHD